MTQNVFLPANTWTQVNTTDDVLISGGQYELAFAASQPATSDDGHTLRIPVKIPKGSKAWVRASGMAGSGQKVKLSSLGTTAYNPVTL